MELLKLPEQALTMLFGPQSIFANWVAFFIANWIVISLGGFILSNWMNRKPDGIIDRKMLSEKIAEKSSWYLALSIFGIALAFIYNVFIYSVFFILEITRFITDFLFKWIKFVLLWIWEQVFLPSIWMFSKLVYRYVITMPFQTFLSVIQFVPSVLNRSQYQKVLWPTLIGSLVSAIAVFVGFLMENEMVTNYGAIIIGSLTLTWIVANHIYGTREAAIKSLLFSLVLSGFSLALLGILYFLNKGDASIKWGGSIAGILNAPTILGSLIVLIVSLSMLFSSSIGVIYSNTTNEKNWLVKIREFFVETFKRSLSFCYQYILVAIVGMIITVLPIGILQMVSEEVGESIVGVHLENKNKELQKELKLFTTSDELTKLMNVDSTKDAAFAKELDSLKQECTLNYQIGENNLYSAYISRAGKFGIDLLPVHSRKEYDARIKQSEASLKDLEESKKQQIADLEEMSKSFTTQIDEATRSLTQIINNPMATDYYNEVIANCNKELGRIENVKKRTTEYNDLLIAEAKSNHDSLKENWVSYSLTYFLYLLSKYALFSLVIAFFFSLFARTVRPTYDSYTGSGVVAAFRSEKEKNANQPWLAFLLLGALALAMMNPNKVINEPLKWMNSLLSEMKGSDAKKDVKENNSDANQNAISTENAQSEELTEPVETAEDVAASEGTPSEEPSYFYCNDGQAIPLAYYNDGGCDCNTCEDEN